MADNRRSGKSDAKRQGSIVGSMFKSVRFVFFFLLLPILVGGGIGGFAAFARSVPSIAELKRNVTPPSTKIYADDGSLIGEIKIEKGKYVSLDLIPKELINAVVAVEDSHYWKHSGVDYMAIARAAFKDILKRHLKEGGSTITQQLAKITFLTPEKTFTRKLRELILARRIEKSLAKEDILEFYLNRVYFGHGAYGVEMAAQVYFGKSISEITLPEAAIIAGLLKAPSTYSPFRNFKKAKSRQAIVLQRMEEEGFINRKHREKAGETPIYLAKKAEVDSANNYFIEYIKRDLEKKYGAETLYKGGLSVHTTLNRHAQAVAQRAIQKGLRDLDKRRGWRGPVDHMGPEELTNPEKSTVNIRTQAPVVGDIAEGVVMSVTKDKAQIRFSGITGTLWLKDALWAQKTLNEETQEHKWIRGFNLTKILEKGDVILVQVKSMGKGDPILALEQEPEVQGALVAMETHSGFIRALVGGYDFEKTEFNRALYARRQPGSAFKPFIFSVALNSGFTPATVVQDEEITFENGPDDYWTPRNYDDEFHGPTRLRDALAYSRNVPTVKLVDEIGIDRIIKFARRVGIESNLPRNLTISLGSMSITPLQLTAAYNAFANNGIRMDPVGIKYVTDRRGRVIENSQPQGTRVLDEQTAFLMTSMLKSVVSYGTGWRAKAIGRNVAGKTGTTDDYRDAWFLGYTRELVTGVWVGFDDVRPLGHEETGSRAASPIWVDFMKAVSAGSSEDFEIPAGITTRIIDPVTGLLANQWTDNAFEEFFKEGTEPTKFSSSIWQTNEPTNFFY